jgi:hypothetical protein
MTQTLLIALIASAPAAGLSFAAAWAVEAMGAGLKLRLAAWTTALLLPVALVPAMLAIQSLGVRSPLAELREPPPAAAPASAPDNVAVASSPELLPVLAPGPVGPPLPPISLPMALLGLIAAGAVLRLGGLGLGLRRVARLAARSEAIVDPALAARLGRGVRQGDNSTPILAGVIRPVILLPRRLIAGLPAEQAALVCAHERAHLAAGDHLSHLMEETLVRLFWFNPLLAAVRERLAAAREEACDARALAGCDDISRRAYAQTLIAALRLAGPTEPVAALTGFRRRGAQRRLRAILKPASGGSWRAIAAASLAGVGLTAALGGVSLALAAEPQPGQPVAPPAPAAASAAPLAVPIPPAPPASPAPSAPDAHPGHHHQVIVMRQDGNKGGKDHAEVHTMVFDDGNAPFANFDPERMPGMSPEERERLKRDMKQAHEAMAKAMADAHQAMEKAHQQMADARALTEQDRARIHLEADEAVMQAHAAMAQNDGRVLMRCKLGPDGKATDCQQLGPGSNVMFWLRRGPGGPDGAMPPRPPMPPMPPMPPPPAPPPPR